MSEKTHDFNRKDFSQLPHMAAEPLYGPWEQVVRGYKQFCAMAAAVRLRIFDHLVELRQPMDLAVQLNADPKMITDSLRFTGRYGIIGSLSGRVFSVGA